MPPLDMSSSNMPAAWSRWLTQFKIYLRANNLEEERDARLVAILLHLIGEDALATFYSFNLDIDKTSFAELIAHFEKHFKPQINVTMERHKLFNRRQGLDETIDMYVTDLRNTARQCEFGSLYDSIVRDIFSLNLNSNNFYIKEKILTDKPDTLDKAVSLAKAMESTKLQSQELQGHIQVINTNARNSYMRRPQAAASTTTQQPVKRTCSNCGQVHRHHCPAQGKKCHNCGRWNHFSDVCRAKVKSVKFISNAENDDDIDCIPNVNCSTNFLGSIYINSICKNESWRVDLSINNKEINFLLDTGADTNIMSVKTFRFLNFSSASIQNSEYKLSTFSGELIPTVGKLTCPVRYNKHNYNITFHIVDMCCQDIVGRDTCRDLNLINRIQNVNLNCMTELPEDLTTGIGCLKNFEVNLQLKPDACPTISACRRLPFQLRGPLQKELADMEKEDIIQKVEEPTDWVSPIVITSKKNGQIRLCIDPRKLNEAIMRPHFQFPTLDEIKSDLAQAKYFTTLDANKGFWMLKLSEASSKLTTFITPFGRYRFKRLPFGVNAAPEIFHSEMIKRFHDIPNVKIMMDDFLIYGRTVQEHNDTLNKVLDRAREIGLVFNKEKSSICKQEIRYLGHFFSTQGIKVDPTKIEAITNMPIPTNLTELQRFMGMVNYLGSFIPNLSKESSLLRQLLSKTNEWIWTEKHETEFKTLKDLLCSAPVLCYYDPAKEIYMSVDASKDALGAVICHDKHPIAYASASLNSCQQNYSQIEKELLAILFGCNKFHQYIYGKQINVETDHKPLITLFKRPLFDIPARLQRIMLRLQPYDINLTYKPGRYLFIADTLSRAPLPDTALTDLDRDLDLHINLVLTTLSVTPQKLSEIQESTKSDSILSKVIEYCQKGWPEHKRSVSADLKPYFLVKDDLHVINNMLLKANTIVIPKSMREYTIKTAHQGHQGLNSCLRLAKSTVYWPNMSNDFERYINQCHTCLTYHKNNTKEPILHHEYKLIPWSKVGIDLFDFDNQKYVIVVDYFSKFIELALLHTDSTAKTVIIHLKSIFARHGIPEVINSDNGPPFNSREFGNFASEWGIQHITSSPYLSRSNGMVERSIGIIKNMLKKCKSDNQDPYLALLSYRNTPKETGYSPSQLLMSRNLRTNLPTTDSSLTPRLVDLDKLKDKIDKQKDYSTHYYNQHAKVQPQVNVGDKVYFKHKPNNTWIPGIISEACSQPRSYVVKSPEGSFRRNREHILKPASPVTVSENKTNCNSNIDKQTVVTYQAPNAQNLPKTTHSGRVINMPKRYCD